MIYVWNESWVLRTNVCCLRWKLCFSKMLWADMRGYFFAQILRDIPACRAYALINDCIWSTRRACFKWMRTDRQTIQYGKNEINVLGSYAMCLQIQRTGCEGNYVSQWNSAWTLGTGHVRIHNLIQPLHVGTQINYSQNWTPWPQNITGRKSAPSRPHLCRWKAEIP